MPDEEVLTVVVDTDPAPYSVIEVVTSPITEFQVETAGPPGAPGPAGPPGEPSVGATVEYSFPDPVLVWEGEHPYVGKPTVILEDQDGATFLSSVSYPQVRYNPLDPQLGVVVVRFALPQAGTLVIRA